MWQNEELSCSLLWPCVSKHFIAEYHYEGSIIIVIHISSLNNRKVLHCHDMKSNSLLRIRLKTPQCMVLHPYCKALVYNLGKTSRREKFMRRAP
jgi:hypothetical protein